MTDRRYISQYSQPTKWIIALEGLQRPLRNALAANSVVPVAASDEIAGEFVCPAVVSIAHLRVRAIEFCDGNLRRVENKVCAGRRPCVDQVLGDLRLPVDRNRAARQALQIDARGSSGKG